MLQLLNQLSTRKIILPGLLLFLFFNLFLFPRFTVQKDGELLQPLDLRLSYNRDDVMDLLGQLGTDGRATYRMGISIIDSIYPFVYTLLLISLLSATLRALFGKTSGKLYVAILPVCILIFDFLENFNTLSLLRHYPEITEDSVSMGSAFTTAKWISTFTSAAILLMCIAILLFGIFRNKRKRPAG